MKTIRAMSVFDCFSFVMDEHDFDYVIVSIQDNKPGGFGVLFTETTHCRGVLNLQFDDVDCYDADDLEQGKTPFASEQAQQILGFVHAHDSVDTIIIHCYGGISRSAAVKFFLYAYYGIPYTEEVPFLLNQHVYRTLMQAWKGEDV